MFYSIQIANPTDICVKRTRVIFCILAASFHSFSAASFHYISPSLSSRISSLSCSLFTHFISLFHTQTSSLLSNTLANFSGATMLKPRRKHRYKFTDTKSPIRKHANWLTIEWQLIEKSFCRWLDLNPDPLCP